MTLNETPMALIKILAIIISTTIITRLVAFLMTKMERFKKEVIASPCFDFVRKMHDNFNDFINSKIVPIEGDLVSISLAANAHMFSCVNS